MDSQDRLQRVISKTNDSPDSSIEGAVLRNWVVVADWVGVDGDKWLSHIANKDSSAWEIVGLLQTAMDERRNIVAGDDD